MSTPAIVVDRIGKKYKIGLREESRHRSLREALVGVMKAPFQRLRTLREQTSSADEFWALKDVSFEVQPGEVVGIIGRNGAGKSTLLKILSRITEPTEGEARIHGRVGSLLEVGTGFNPELTGRENIYLNGALLGMKKAEINRKFAEIVAFSEIDKFLDTPVKRYSSGMYVRLAFAVAAHLEPEILVVDEVLAVGDAQFQRKCLGKMGDAAKGGRTVLFVSHNMAAVRSLCDASILLEQGKVVCAGSVEATLSRYLRGLPSAHQPSNSCLARNETLGIELTGVELLDGKGNLLPAIQTGAHAALQMSLESRETFRNVTAAIGVNSLFDDVRICMFYSGLTGDSLRLEPTRTKLICSIPKVPLTPGRYRLTLKLMSGSTVLFYLPGALEIDVVDGDFYGTGRLPDKAWGGVTVVDHSWKAHSS